MTRPTRRSRNAEVDFRGERRSNATHVSTTDPEARLFKKSPGAGAVLCFMGHSLMEKGAMDGPAFATYIREVLIPEINPGTVVILDNLATHRNRQATEALRAHGCWFLYLPPYSPDLNPIEMAFAKLKAHLRRIGARTFTEVFKAIGQICDLYGPDECSNYFTAAGYASS